MILEILRDYWGVLSGLIVYVVWLVRLEAKQMSHSREIEYINERRNEDLRASKEARDETSRRLDLILADVRESNRDIKDLLTRLGK